jgi:integrase
MKRPKPKPLKLKGVKRVKAVLADGSMGEYLYHRASGKRLDEKDLVQSFADAERAMRTKSRGTLSDLIRNFDSSGFFKDLSEATKESYLPRLRVIDAKWGSVPIEATQDKEFRRDVLAWHEQMGKKSRSSADNTLVTLAKVLSYAKEKAVIELNVLDTFTRLYKSDRSEMVWSDALVARFLELASPPMRTAMFLGRNTGQRQKDVRELPWSAYDGVGIKLRQSKTGALVEVPCTRELKSYLDTLPRVSPLILTTVTGRAFAARHFAQSWRAVSEKAGAGELNFHDLRGTAATQLAEAGATVPMIASIMGWSHDSAQKIISSYVARNSNLAKAGIELLEAYRAKRPHLRSSP